LLSEKNVGKIEVALVSKILGQVDLVK